MTHVSLYNRLEREVLKEILRKRLNAIRRIMSRYFCLVIGVLGMIIVIISIHLLSLENMEVQQSLDRMTRKRNHFINVCKKNGTNVRNILYVKIQKTGSTTWKTVLISYSEKYKLQLCMDASDIWHTNWPYQLDPDKLTRYYKTKCDVIADEMIYNENVINDVMNENPFFLTSVRDPVQHFLSLYKYAKIHEVVQSFVGRKNLTKWQGIETYFKHYHLIRNFWITLGYSFKPVAMLKRNLQLYSLGLDNENPRLSEIQTIANKIDHFILSGNATESLLILHRKLCCEMHDLYYTRQNVGRSQKDIREPIPKHIIDKILNHNNGDAMLYDIARKRLSEDIEMYGDGYKADLSSFEEGLKTYTQYCKNKSKITLPYKKECITQSSGFYFQATEVKLKKRLIQRLRLELKRNSSTVPN